jgi:hypothetical protein
MGEIAMSDITNADRAAWAATAIEAFTSECRMDGEDNQTKAKDLATNLVHYLRMECGLSLEEACNVIHNAVGMAEQETDEDGDGDDDQPIEREYGVRLFATFRGECDQTVKAFSFDEAVAKARLLKHNDFNYSINDNVEGDETLMVYGPDDDDRTETDPWAGDGASLDARPDGEPFSWDACQLVKDLAKLNPIAELLRGDDMKASVSVEQLGVIANLIIRAREMCPKEE